VLQRVVADFEAATWQAVRQVLPGLEIRGCLFHYTQAIYRKVQELGLTTQYAQDAGSRSMCRDVMALPLLPAEHIAPVFDNLTAGEMQVPALQELVTYVRAQWIAGPVFKSTDISVFGQVVRTNNDVEGWHCRLNTCGKKASLPLSSDRTIIYRGQVGRHHIPAVVQRRCHQDTVTRIKAHHHPTINIMG